MSLDETLPGMMEKTDLTAAFGGFVMLLTMLAVWFNYAEPDQIITRLAFTAALIAVFGPSAMKAIQKG